MTLLMYNIEPSYLPLHLRDERDFIFLDFEGAFETLRERDAEMLKHRYGFYGESQTLKQVAAHFGISIERVRQVLARGLRKLRHPRIRKFIWKCE